MPLFLLSHLHKKSVGMARDWVFTDRLHESSISFWMYVLEEELEEAKLLLSHVLRHGNNKTKRLARRFLSQFLVSG